MPIYYPLHMPSTTPYLRDGHRARGLPLPRDFARVLAGDADARTRRLDRGEDRGGLAIEVVDQRRGLDRDEGVAPALGGLLGLALAEHRAAAERAWLG